MIVLYRLWIVLVLFVDVTKVVVSITVPRIDFCRFYVPFDGFFFVPFGFVDNSKVVIRAVVRRLQFYAFLVVENRLLIIFYLVIGDGKRVVKAMFFHVLIDSPFNPSNRLFYLRLVVVRQAYVVAEDILSNFISLRLLQNLLICVFKVIKDISQVLICSFVLIISLHSSEVPYFCLIISLQELIIDTNIVVARTILRIDLSAFCVPFDGFFVHLLDSTVANTNFIAYSRVFWV